MTAKSIITVDIDDSRFNAFYALFQKYQAQIDEMPEGWEKIVDKIDDAGDGMKEFSKASMSSKDFMMIAAIQAGAISKAIHQATGVQDKFNAKTKDGAIQMGKMAKFSKEMHKDISKMSGVLLKLGALGGSALAIPTAIFASVNKLAGQNLQARGLGLRIGQTQAFEANFEKFGLGGSDLGNIANAQGEPSKWRAFMSAGLTPQQIQGEDTEQLTFNFAKAASSKYRQWLKEGGPLRAASLAQGSGFTDILSLQQLRTGASYSDADWEKAQRKAIEAAKKAEVDQKTADQASDVKASLKSDWAQVLNTFNEQLASASPELRALGESAAAAAVQMLKIAGPEAKSLLHAIENPGVVGPNEGRVTSGLRKMGNWIRGSLGLEVSEPQTGDTSNQLESSTGLPSGILGAQYQVESNAGRSLLSPKGAMGPMQFMKPTWDQWGNGGDVNNLRDSMMAASRYDSFLLKRYGGDVRKTLAAYNWGMGNLDKSIAKNGANWEAHAPMETQSYINKIVKLMARQGQGVNINITNSTPSRVAVSMNAAAH